MEKITIGLVAGGEEGEEGEEGRRGRW